MNDFRRTAMAQECGIERTSGSSLLFQSFDVFLVGSVAD